MQTLLPPGSPGSATVAVLALVEVTSSDKEVGKYECSCCPFSPPLFVMFFVAMDMLVVVETEAEAVRT